MPGAGIRHRPSASKNVMPQSWNVSLSIPGTATLLINSLECVQVTER
jgi:hypothetical protein